MADQTMYTREELENMSRLVLRKECKKLKMSSEDCSKMKFDDMVEWFLEKQGGDGSKKTAPKARDKKTPPKAGKAGRKKAPPKTPPKSKKTPPKAASRDDEGSGEVTGDDLLNTVLEAIGELKDRLTSVEEKVDTLGEVVDTNIAPLVGDIDELRADSYKQLELAMHYYQWTRADGILTDEAAPDGLDFEDKAAAIDEECAGGNDEGDE